MLPDDRREGSRCIPLPSPDCSATDRAPWCSHPRGGEAGEARWSPPDGGSPRRRGREERKRGPARGGPLGARCLAAAGGGSRCRIPESRPSPARAAAGEGRAPTMARTAPPAVPPPPPGPPARGSLSLHRAYLRSPLGLLRLGQLVLGAAFWVTVAAHKYEGAAHFALFAAVLVWLLTLALFGLSLLGRWALVPWLGSRWLLTNLVHDLALGVGLYAAATGIMGYKAGRKSYCNLPGYSQQCLYGAYLSASICGGITAFLYLFSGLYCLLRRCRDQRDII